VLKSEFSTKVNYFPQLLDKIKTKNACVGIIGVGYVGQALVRALLSAGYQTYGYDIDKDKLRSIDHKYFRPTTDIRNFENCDVICICVPTPLDRNRKPDLNCLRQASSDVASLQRQGQLVIVESTVAPGTLRTFVLPIFEGSGKKCGRDFYLAISPERVDPGNTRFTIKNTPKVVGGIDEISAFLAVEFYSNFIERVVPTTTAEVAELSKILENTFRLVNISLINEIKNYADRSGIDIWEVIDTAATKPFAFMPHYPGPGVGGHCIPVDPVYLVEEARNKGVRLGIVESAIAVNEAQPKKIVQEAKKALNGRPNGKKAKMLLVGIAYKPGSSDTRESPALKIWEEAERRGFRVSYFDPHVPKLNGHASKPLNYETLLEQDVIIIATDHQGVPYEMLGSLNKPIIDSRNILKKFARNNSLKSKDI